MYLLQIILIVINVLRTKTDLRYMEINIPFLNMISISTQELYTTVLVNSIK